MQDDLCEVIFTYEAETESELSVTEGEFIRFLQKHDLDGNLGVVARGSGQGSERLRSSILSQGKPLTAEYLQRILLKHSILICYADLLLIPVIMNAFLVVNRRIFFALICMFTYVPVAMFTNVLVVLLCYVLRAYAFPLYNLLQTFDLVNHYTHRVEFMKYVKKCDVICTLLL